MSIASEAYEILQDALIDEVYCKYLDPCQEALQE